MLGMLLSDQGAAVIKVERPGGDPARSKPAVATRLVEAASPKWLRIGGYWYPRGGIPIDVFYQTGEAPEGVWIPDQGVAPYRGRG